MTDAGNIDQISNYRMYPNDPESSVYQHYYNKNTKQTLEFAKDKLSKYKSKIKTPLYISTVLQSLNNYIDPSDPDTDVPNLIHAYQTAERIRKDFPKDDALQVTGLIHDIGKFLFTFGDPDWAVVGDIHPVGCQFSSKCVYPQFFVDNPDKYDKYGIYQKHCGLDNLYMCWGHDEYLYQVLSNSQQYLPKEYMKIIRFHSFYPLHLENEYTYFLNDEDTKILPKIKKFSSYDLYSKHDTFELTQEIIDYYDELLNKFFPEPLFW
jgi:inositol oxygenase